jgi:uncharacterized membrane protein YfcA
MPSDVLSIVLAAAAAMLMGLSKTMLPGASILSVALMAAAFPDGKLSVGAMLPILLAGDVFAVTWFRRHAQWDRIVAVAPFIVLGGIPGYFVLYWFVGSQLKPLLGGLVAVMLAIEVLRNALGAKASLSGRWFSGMAGSLAGFATVVGNAGGPIMNLYLLSRGLVKEQFIGTCAWLFFLINLSKVIPFWHDGMLTRQTVPFGLMMLPACLFGGLLGTWILPWISQRVFSVAIWLLTAVAAVWLMIG